MRSKILSAVLAAGSTVIIVGAVPAMAASAAPPDSPNLPAGSAGVATLGIHDGSINYCDNNEKWVANGNTVSVSPPNGPAAQQVMLNTAPNPVDGTPWFSGLNAHTVRFSAPWDIALPDTTNTYNGQPAADLVTANDPTSQWALLHLAALRNEQTCLDWWLDAARQVGGTVQIAFKPDYDYRNFAVTSAPQYLPKNAILAPSQAVYQAAMTAFADEYSLCRHGSDSSGSACVQLSGSAGPTARGTGSCAGSPCGRRVTIISPWGEPDFGSDNTAGNSLTAAQASNGVAITASPQRFYIPDGYDASKSRGNTLDDPNCNQGGSYAASSLNTNWCGPVLGAQYYMAVLKECGTACELTSGTAARQPNSGIVAGDYSSTAAQTAGTVYGLGSQPYWQTYDQHLNNTAGGTPIAPHTWGLHPYTDVSDYEYCTGDPGNSYPPAGYLSKVTLMERNLNSLGLNAASSTSLWLNEISVYHAAQFNPPSACSNNVSHTFSGRRQAFAFLFLNGAGNEPTLPGSVPAGDAPISRLYYLRASGTAADATYIDPGVFDCLYQTMHTLAVASSC